MRRGGLLLAATFLYGFAACAVEIPPERVGAAQHEIMQGTDDDAMAFPAVVQVTIAVGPNITAACTGTLISDRSVGTWTTLPPRRT